MRLVLARSGFDFYYFYGCCIFELISMKWLDVRGFVQETNEECTYVLRSGGFKLLGGTQRVMPNAVY